MIRTPNMRPCLDCDGTGVDPHDPAYGPCPACDGTGWVEDAVEDQADE